MHKEIYISLKWCIYLWVHRNNIFIGEGVVLGKLRFASNY